MRRVSSKHGGHPPKPKSIGHPCSKHFPEEKLEDCPELATALNLIVSAFVDLGFGASASQQTLRAANDNRQIRELAENFRRNAV